MTKFQTVAICCNLQMLISDNNTGTPIFNSSVEALFERAIGLDVQSGTGMA